MGSALLVKPITHDETYSIEVYLPGDQPWYEYGGSHTAYEGSQRITVSAPLDKIPVFQRGGTIIPKKDRVRRSSSLMHDDPYTLQIALNKHHEASGEIYLDDGHSFDYTRGAYLYRQFNFKNNALENIKLGDSNQTYQPKGSLIERIVILGYSQGKPSKVILQQSPSSQTKEIEFEYDSKHNLLTLRKPNLLLASSWTLVILQ